jgi:hypothetical protein
LSAIFEHHPWTVNDLMAGVSNKSIRLPDLQRPFVWKTSKVRDLMDSMYRGYPVGELMFWHNTAEDHTKTIGTNNDEKPKHASYQIVDGQQRLTSLFAVTQGYEVFREGYAKEVIKVAFNPRTGRFEVPGVATKGDDWIQDIADVFRGNTYTVITDYVQRLKAKFPDLSREDEQTVADAILRLAKLMDYKFQVIELKQDINHEQVADIFVRINSEGMNLSSADFILTWMSVFWEEGRNQLEDFARDSRFPVEYLNAHLGQKAKWSPYNPYLAVTPGQMLRVSVAYGLRRGRLGHAYNALRGANPRTGEIVPENREKELARLKAGQEIVLRDIHWDEFLRVLERAGFRSSSMITSSNAVLYTYAIWLIGRVDFEVPVDQLREIMARWFFMSQITGRYTNSPESQISEDLDRLDEVLASRKNPEDFVSELNALINASVPEDWWRVTLVENLRTSSTTAPAYVAYIAALNVLQAKVLLSTSYVRDWINPHHTAKKGIEKHHLFPKDYLKSTLGVTSTKNINQVANYALLEWWDNIAISNQPPSSYWPEQIGLKKLDESRIAEQAKWHALPDGWTSMQYNEFIEARRSLMAQVTHEGYKYLGDPNYQPVLERVQVSLDEAGASTNTFEDLFIVGEILPEDVLTLTNDEDAVRAEVQEDGTILIGSQKFASPAAALTSLGIDAIDVWEYWQVEREGNKFPLASLRR